MTYEEYSEKLIEIRKESREELKKKESSLAIEFVKKNNPYKIGDKIADHIGTIVIEKIGWAYSLIGKPNATYFGTELKKDGTPQKGDKKRTVWQNNILKDAD